MILSLDIYILIHNLPQGRNNHYPVNTTLRASRPAKDSSGRLEVWQSAVIPPIRPISVLTKTRDQRQRRSVVLIAVSCIGLIYIRYSLD